MRIGECANNNNSDDNSDMSSGDDGGLYTSTLLSSRLHDHCLISQFPIPQVMANGHIASVTLYESEEAA